MDWITGLQRAIDYIEAHLTEEISYDAVAREAYVSPFYFQRVFSILCGYPVGEYIRCRRLTLAGAELLATDRKVIDLALKYGYDSPESFTRAFTRFHGITPTAARANLAPLTSFARLSIQISMKGGERMQYRIENKEAFRLIARGTRCSDQDEKSREEIPQFWERCHQDGTVRWLQEHRKADGVIGGNIAGLCMEDSRKTKKFPYFIAAEYAGGEMPEGFEVYDIPALTWAVFDATGTMPDAIQQLWHRVFAEFFPTSGYQPLGNYDLELYSDGAMNAPDYHSEIWVAVTHSVEEA